MIETIAIETYWEMSHRLPYHQGLCSNIHGHTYKMRVAVSGHKNAQGMLIDFYELKRIVNTIIEKLDHCFICDKDDKIMIEFLTKNNFKLFIIPEYTTVENISEFLVKEIQSELKKFENIKKIELRLYETQDTFAEISIEN